MAFTLPKLDYAEDALEPHISEDVVHYHYGKHTAKYFEKANELAKGTIFANKQLDDVISKDSVIKMDTALFNNVSQAFNHAFYWKCLAPASDVGKPSDELNSAIEEQFDTFAKFKDDFIEKATKAFGSAWVWLVLKDGKVQIKVTPNANSPLTETKSVPLLNCDIWEHAYLYDERFWANRPAYLNAYWTVINWNFVNENFKNATSKE